MFRSKRRLADCRVIVTGASSGIGRAMASELARRGARLLVTARRARRLAELTEQITAAGGHISFLVGDIRDADHRHALVAAADERLGGLDLLINNAGVGAIGSFATAAPDRLRQVMDVNFFSVAELIRAALPMLRASSDAAIVNIGSVLGHVAVPLKSEYCASKFALHGFSDALRAELSRERIEVLLVSPSTTASEFFDQAMRSAGSVPDHHRAMTSEQVAMATIHAVERRRREVILSSSGIFLVWADRLLPDLTGLLLRRFAQQQPTR